MDSIINFLGANPYQAIAVPVVGGLASGNEYSTAFMFLLMCARIHWQSPHHRQVVVPRPPQTSLQSAKLDFPSGMDGTLCRDGLFISSRRPRRNGNSI